MGEAKLKDEQLAAQFIYGVIRIEVIHQGEKTAFGWKRGEFGIVPNSHFYELIHLPSAMSLRMAGGMFTRDTDAMRAAIEIDRLRNQWTDVTFDDFHVLATPIFKICTKHFGRVVLGGPKEMTISNEHNGFTGKLPE